MSLVKTFLELKASISSKTYRLLVVPAKLRAFSYLAIPKLELSYKLKKTKNKRYRFLCIVHFSFLIKSM